MWPSNSKYYVNCNRHINNSVVVNVTHWSDNIICWFILQIDPVHIKQKICNMDEFP